MLKQILLWLGLLLVFLAVAGAASFVFLWVLKALALTAVPYSLSSLVAAGILLAVLSYRQNGPQSGR